MVMRKILFGTTVFFSLAFLAACGGGGSGSSGAAGAAGAAGADGAAGAAGSIAVPTDVVATTTVQKDLDSTALEIDVHIDVSGIDNSTADSRLRYYVYQGTSATAKYKLWDPGTSVTVASPATFSTTSLSTGNVIDPRFMTQDNITLDSVGTASSALPGNTNSTGPLVTHMIICSGNAAGDAATCDSEAIADRVATSELVVAEGATVLQVSAVYANSAFQILADNASAGTTDNSTIAYTIADNMTKANFYAGKTSWDGTRSQVTSGDNASAVTALSAFSPNIGYKHLLVSNIFHKGADVYFVTSDNTSQQRRGPDNASGGCQETLPQTTTICRDFDNITFYKRTGASGDFALDNETNLAQTIASDWGDNNTGSPAVLMFGSDGTDIFGVRDGAVGSTLLGMVYQDNGSLALPSPQAIGTTDMCVHVQTDKMIIVVDNGTSNAAGNYAGFDVFTLYDNGTMGATATDSSVSGLGTIMSCDLELASSTYILAVREDDGDNITVLSSTDLISWTQIYEAELNFTTGSKISLVAPNGTSDVWVAADDASNVLLYHSDNGTSGGLALVHTTSGAGLGNIVHDGGAAGAAKIGIAVDSGGDAGLDIYYE